MCLCMYVAMSENRFLRFLPFILFRVSHSMKCRIMMGRPFVFERGGALAEDEGELLFLFDTSSMTYYTTLCVDIISFLFSFEFI